MRVVHECTKLKLKNISLSVWMLKSLLFFLSPYFNFKFQCFLKAKSLKLKSSLSVLRQILATESAESADYIILHYIILYIIWITPLKVSKLSKHLSSLENFPRRTVTTKVITTFLSSILTSSNFVFNCKSYLEIKGCAMGKICAPAYANIFMDRSERKHIYPFLGWLSLSYLSSLTIYSLFWRVARTSK